MTREEIVVGLDIGTTKVGTVIATGDASGTLTVTGVGTVHSRGIKRGVIIDVEETITAIRESVERAAHMAGVKAEGAVAGITGDHIDSSNRRGTATVASRTGNITRFDVERVLQAAALEIGRDREIIHSLPRGFVVDGHAGVKRPLGMAGQRLEVETHIVTGKASFLQNAVQCVEKAGLSVEALVLEPIATAEAVTTEDERDMGVMLIDIGGGTSDIAVFEDGSIVYSGVLPVGGNHVTRDIAIGLRTPFELAERIKIESGAAMPDLIPHGEALEVTMAGSGERLRIPRSLLGEIIEARMSEMCELARSMMHEGGVRKRLPAGIILTGGGALLPGALELATEIFQMPTRLGYPLGVEGWSDQVAIPQFATGVGLCRFALKQRYAPGNQTEIPAIAATEGRRIWGAITPAPVARTLPRIAAPAPANEPLSAAASTVPGFDAPRFETRAPLETPKHNRPLDSSADTQPESTDEAIPARDGDIRSRQSLRPEAETPISSATSPIASTSTASISKSAQTTRVSRPATSPTTSDGALDAMIASSSERGATRQKSLDDLAPPTPDAPSSAQNEVGPPPGDEATRSIWQRAWSGLKRYLGYESPA